MPLMQVLHSVRQPASAPLYRGSIDTDFLNFQAVYPLAVHGQKMKYPRYTCVSVAFFCVLIAAGTLQSVAAKRYCGDQLPKALAMLCVEYFTLEDLRKNTVGFYPQVSPDQFTAQLHWSGENFNENEFKRNFNVAPPVGQFEAMDDVDDWTSRSFRQKPFHRFLVPHIKARLRRNVANECCREDCNMDQLLSYCKVVAPGVLND
ncbi:uncharacterized protein LOC125767090 isoform X2 [Anopheles funestus]|uniref:uncharacterized protein LOC125767090 isoform X2 n=1 Tax=Anopheles funestus TaxID=62324 RepID=UPI0020C71148|nr:uncharacterized protein LOC125767090 isoform X2 [Anopheles funestus]